MTKLSIIITTVMTLWSPFKGFTQDMDYEITDFYNSNPSLEREVIQIFDELTDSARVAQMIVTSAGELGKSNQAVLKLASENKIGGVVFLKGTKEKHKSLIDELNEISKVNRQIPLLFSIDAEPSLLNGRLQGSHPIKNTINSQMNET